MDDRPEWAEPWPFWKFGLNHDDLHTTLHTKYNTVPSAIQDPEAFHHDVYEISTRASSLPEFEQLMEERKEERLKELNTMLQDASFEIVGNPGLIGTVQWEHAVQLFRSQSLDSLVRYFASYLPEEHPWHRDSDSTLNDSGSDAASLISPIDYDGPSLFEEPEEEAISYSKPSQSFVEIELSEDGPLRSMTGRSEDSGVSVNERRHRRHSRKTKSAARTTSMSESERDHHRESLQISVPTLHDDGATTPSDTPDTPNTSVSDLSEIDEHEPLEKDAVVTSIMDDEDVDGYLSVSQVHLQATDTLESDSPTPKAKPARSPAAPSTGFFDTKLSPFRSPSSRTHPHHAHPTHVTAIDEQVCRKQHLTTRQLRRREDSLDRVRRTHAVIGGRVGRPRDVSPAGTRSRARAHQRRNGS